jgi:hypothetical protein
LPEMSLMERAKELFTRRGGAEAAKQDAQEIKDTAQSDASMGDKAKEAVEAVKEPGAPGEAGTAGEGQSAAGEEQRPRP